MLTLSAQGLHCKAGHFYIDPKGKVENAVVTHAHSDHARRGASQYYCAKSGLGLLKERLGKKISARGIPFGEKFRLGEVELSFHPAGHILGSAQVRLECEGEVWVVSGDYKRDPDSTCEPFESVQCGVFVTEATFGTPAYRWDKRVDHGRAIYSWWEKNAGEGKNSVLHAYSLGKTQRVLGLLRDLAKRPIYCHPAALALNDCYRAEGISLADYLSLEEVSSPLTGELIIAPPGTQNSFFGDHLLAFASGWMAKQSRGYDGGFALSDHADWEDLLRSVRESGARRVYVQHRGKGALVRELCKQGLEAYPEEELGKKHSPSAQLSLF